ncbi:endonuclease [Maribacter algicola]|uniref:Endonuclease n=1 Tax=Maribacter algicola TaxID=2498892 RepID=A0A426RI64_9FLAO|nr:endonuclease/exonuclease/phosphatase family protein [Maribacter algicola]RRQ48638.1 endonuclease [Maribacter algicola]
MKRFFSLIFLVLVHFGIHSQESISLVSWNIRDFGKSKNSAELEQIAEIVRDADILAIQEVVAGYGGAQAVAKLSDILNRKGAQWDYVISDPTNSSKYVTERYAFIWKTRHIKIKNRGALIKDLVYLVDREPFYLDFYLDGEKVTVLNFHSRPHDNNPEAEIAAISAYLAKNDSYHPIILAGDFNVDEKEAVFDEIKGLDFKAAISNQPTTLKHACDGHNYLNYPIDNIFYRGVRKEKGSVIDFVKVCENLEDSRKLSDHLPVYLSFSLLNAN